MDDAADVLEELARRGASLAVAESLTGGLVAARVTDVPGASRVFRGSVTAYATVLKRDVLGVDGDLLDARGAVDPEVALGMAGGVRRALGADWGIATTGVAGPAPQDGKPVGTVFVAVVGPGRGTGAVREFHLEGDRTAVRGAAVHAVLGLLRDELFANGGAAYGEHHGEI
ncbi:CinA family protein [Streptomyces sp. NPDC054784]